MAGASWVRLSAVDREGAAVTSGRRCVWEAARLGGGDERGDG